MVPRMHHFFKKGGREAAARGGAMSASRSTRPQATRTHAEQSKASFTTSGHPNRARPRAPPLPPKQGASTASTRLDGLAMGAAGRNQQGHWAE